MTNNNGGPAFPVAGSEHNYPIEGMTLRDYFAAKVLSGWLASYPGSNLHPVAAGNADEVAKQAYMLADAMLRAREVS